MVATKDIMLHIQRIKLNVTIAMDMAATSCALHQLQRTRPIVFVDRSKIEI
jgi:hypothetical protein